MKATVNYFTCRCTHKRIGLRPGHIYVALAVALFAALLLGQAARARSFLISEGLFQNDVQVLETGAVIEREIAGGEAHTYRITLSSGQYLRVVVTQRSVDVVVKLSGPDGASLAEVNHPSGIQEPERVSLVVEASGDYRIEVRPLRKEAARGRYELRVEELRAATEQDRSRAAAERLVAEGDTLRAKNLAESLRGAIKKYEEALPLWQAVADRVGEASTLFSIGFVYRLLNEYQPALDHYQRALVLFRAAGHRGEGAALASMGLVYRLLGETEKALDYYGQALKVARAAGDRAGEATTLNNIGTVYQILGEHRRVLEYYALALPILREIGNRVTESVVLNNMGVVYVTLGERRKALEHYGLAIALARETGDRRGEFETLVNLGEVYRLLGEPQKALESYRQALAGVRAAGNRQWEAYALNHLGGLYQEMGEYRQALDYSNQSLQLARSLSDRRWMAIVLNSIGVTHSLLGEHPQASAHYQQSLEISRAVSDPREEARALNNLGALHHQMGDQRKALDYYQQSLRLLRAAANRAGEAAVLHNLGDAHLGLGEMEQAIGHYTQALELRREIEDRAGEAETLRMMARIERDRGQLAQARAHIEAALSHVESLRTKVAGQDLRASYLATKQSHYEFYVDLLMRLHQEQPSKGYDAAALQASERARARSLLETLTEARTDIRQGGDPALLERERDLQQQLNATAERLPRLLSGKHTPEQAAAVRRELDSLLTEYREVQSHIRARSPRYAALTQPQTSNLREIQKQMQGDDTLLLEYALGEDRSFLWAITPNSMTSHVLPRRAEVEQAAQRVYDLLTARNQRPAGETPQQGLLRHAQASAEYPKAAARLSQMLLGPVAAELGAKRLLIVGEGVLQYIPFGALPAPVVSREKTRPPATGYRPLVADHEIVCLPSASVLAALRQELAARKTAPKAVAVLADPVFSSDDQRVIARQAQSKRTLEDRSADFADPAAAVERSARESGVFSLSRLRFSRQEADAIAALFTGAKSLKAVDFEANRATAASAEMAEHRIVHFATHVLLNSQHPELSGVVLSLVDEQGRARDGFLRLHEIYNMKLAADLVVLSACQTALGKEIKGEGLIGLTRGFMYAGSPRVVASLWSVDDRATAELMKRFYKGMVSGRLAPAAALRAAQVQMWKEKGWEDPFYWGGFVLQGEWK